jgi:hypothetical protein
MVAHRTLYEARPAARNLTEFYLWMSLGGALGGLSAALIAPKVFSEVFEYPLILALTMACRPGALALGSTKTNAGDEPRTSALPNRTDDLLAHWLIIATAMLAIYWVPWLLRTFDIRLGEWGSTSVVTALIGLVVLLFWSSPPRQMTAAIMMCIAIITLPSGVKRGDAQRSYFGVYRVMTSGDGNYNILVHGTTLHGAQRIRDSEGNVVADVAPMTYYHEGSPMARTVVARREVLGDKKGRFGVIGLGTGSLACYAGEGERWRFFEIDPTVVRIASDDQHFTFLSSCQPKPDIVIGDARLTIAKEQDKSFDLIIVDAFTSDAVPVHLMTAEALKLFLDKVVDDGIVLLHISNRYLDLEAVLGATGAVVPGVEGIIVSDDESDGSYAQSTSTVVLFAKGKDALAPYRELKGVMDLARGTMRPWTDDYSDILGPFLAKAKRRF